MVASANAADIDDVVGEYHCSTACPPAVPSSTAIARFRKGRNLCQYVLQLTSPT
jgi:hypothetical protein